jgi:archaellin
MKRNKLLLSAAAILALFFLAQFAADMSFLLAPGPQKVKMKPDASLGLKAFSLSSHYFTDAAFERMEADSAAADEALVKQAMALLRRSLERNPLDFQARYYLAKAYLRYSTVNNDYFDLGVRELKRAAAIRGSNKQIALELGTVFFSLWPLLENTDKEFATTLLSAAMPTIFWGEFSPLVEMWSLYVQDTSLLMELLRLKPEFFGLAANQLTKAGIPHSQRVEMLARYEVHTLDALERRYNELTLSGTIALKDARSLLRQLRGLKGYHRLIPESGFLKEKAEKLQRALLLQVIAGLMTDPQATADAQTPIQLIEYIEFYIAEHPGLNELDELQKLLIAGNYFKENDFPSLRLKTLISYKKGDYNGVVSQIESLRKGISFVRKEQTDDYTAILLMLIDSYYSTKLLTAAEAVAQELYQEQPDNLDVLWRVLRVQKILGSEGVPDKVMNEKLAIVENSRFVTVAKAKAVFDVFLFNQPWIEIVLDPALLAQLKPKQLVQVFVDGKIAFENYVDSLPQKIAIGPPFVGIESKVKVQVIVL